MAKVVGIDLGTTNSVVAVMEGQSPTVIANAEGNRTTPSVVAFTKTGERLVGQLAKRQAVTNPDRTISSIKRHMGTDFTVKIDGKDYTPQEISAMVLQKLVNDASSYLGERVTKAVITVPAYFNDAQRQATKDAGKIAGLDVLRIINEPTAAALAYGLDKKGNETILVFDLGGGTFDVSVLEVGDGVFEVKSTNGDTHLGGDDYDHAHRRLARVRIPQGTGHRSQRRPASDAAPHRSGGKGQDRALGHGPDQHQPAVHHGRSERSQAPRRHADARQVRRADERSHANAACSRSRTRWPMPSSTSRRSTRVVMVGGSTRMPVIQELVRKLTGKELNQSVNPDEVVAIGAAIQAGVLSGEVHDVVLLDVTPLSLGLETLGGVATKLIERNTTIPTRKTQVFTTAEDGQTSVDINVLQGEREMAADNKSLGRFRLEGHPGGSARRTAGRGHVQHRCQRHRERLRQRSRHRQGTADHDHRIDQPLQGRSRPDGARRRSDGGGRQGQTRRGRRSATTPTSLIYSTEKSLKEVGDKADAATRAEVEAALTELKAQERQRDLRRDQGGDRNAPSGFVQAGRSALQERPAARKAQPSRAEPRPTVRRTTARHTTAQPRTATTSSTPSSKKPSKASHERRSVEIARVPRDRGR